jgi:hypothetical protein
LQNEIVALREVVKNIVDNGHVPYICLDQIAMDEWELQGSEIDFSALVEGLRAFGALVETLDTFWTEINQITARWDSKQGVVLDRSGNDVPNDLSDSLGTSTSSEEGSTKHFDPRSTDLPRELVPLCNLYDRHILRQNVVIQLSLERVKIRRSGVDTAMEKVDRIYLWHLRHRVAQSTGDHASVEFPEAIGIGDEEMLLSAEGGHAEGVSQEEDDELTVAPMDMNQGYPDYRTMWIDCAQIQIKNRIRCSLERRCGQAHVCLRSRAHETKIKYTQWEITDRRMAAHILLHRRTTQWRPSCTDGI